MGEPSRKIIVDNVAVYAVRPQGSELVFHSGAQSSRARTETRRCGMAIRFLFEGTPPTRLVLHHLATGHSHVVLLLPLGRTSAARKGSS